MVTAYIALGSNLGNRQEHLDEALRLLGQVPRIAVTKVSTYRETEPVGGPAGQGRYLNAAAELQTDLTPVELMQVLLDIETKRGRVREERFGPRTLDLDLLLHGQETFSSAELQVPHPRMHERAFVLEPLAEIAPLVIHPLLRGTVSDLLDRLRGGRELAGLRAMVTGSTSGIGRAIAQELARGGAEVLIHGRVHSKDRAREVATEVEKLGSKWRIVLFDLLQSPDELRSAVASTWHDGLDIWINNAGADTLTGEARHWPFERKLEELWAVDVRATMLLSRDIGARMRERGSGVIINMGWDQADSGMEGDSGQLFGASKGAIMSFTKSLALALAPQVRVNCLAPGWIRTAWGEQASGVWQERVVRETPLARWGTPEDVAQAARWLVSPAARFVTGQVLRVNGGAVRG